MATTPVFVATPNNGTPQTLTTQNLALDGTGTVALLFTAPAGGSLVPAVIVRHLGTNIATVLRLFRNNGSDPTSAANNALIGEVTIAANTLDADTASVPYVAAINQRLLSTERLYATIGTTIVAGIRVSVQNAGDF